MDDEQLKELYPLSYDVKENSGFIHDIVIMEEA